MAKLTNENNLLLIETNIGVEAIQKLIDFNREYQNLVLGYFVKIRNAFHQAYPHITYP
jgi:hypothetical protein